jgi:hypothetical protein
MIIEVDNTACQANINTISIAVTNHITMRSQGRATGDHYTIFHKSINGVPAGMAYMVSMTLCRATKPSENSSRCPSKPSLNPVAPDSSSPASTVSTSK